jgi:hypothetical protein
MKWMLVLLGLMGIQGALADAAFVDFDLGLIYPQELGGMACLQVEKYENEALGYSIFFERGEPFSTEVSVYTLERKVIADGHSPSDVAVVFESVKSALDRELDDELITNFRKKGSAVVPKKGAIQFANTVYQYSEPREVEGVSSAVPRILSVYALAAHNNFFKIQFRFDVAEAKQARAMSEKLIMQLIQTIQAGHSDDELLLAGCEALIHNPADYAGRIAGQQVWGRAQTMGELNVYTHLFVWPDGYRKPKNADLLTAAYFAGMLQVVIPQNLAAGGEREGFIAMLKAYENMRSREDIDSIPQLDEWAKTPDKKALFEELLYAPVEE